jgi:photosystem II stability/assembly factor-like uncharacterized protein
MCSQFFNANTGFIGALEGLVKTTNGGANFTLITNQIHFISSLFFINENTGWCITESGDLYFTSNSGDSFTKQHSFGSYHRSIFFNNASTGFVPGFSGIYKTTNAGESWTYTFIDSSAEIKGVKFTDYNNGWAYSRFSGKIYNTTNGGATWQFQFQRPGQFYGLEAIDSNNLWAVGNTGMNGLICKTTNGGATLIQPMGDIFPDKFSLSQNYPNPFNPVTNIEFSLPQKSFVKLKVFDLLGREVQSLVNENLSAGKYKYDFNASALPSGIYFYKLETENFSETRKMVLLK